MSDTFEKYKANSLGFEAALHEVGDGHLDGFVLE
jgi:hypothetical protein